jgi:hypothetical protein
VFSSLIPPIAYRALVESSTYAAPTTRFCPRDRGGRGSWVNGVLTGKMWQTTTDRLNQEIHKKLPDVWAQIQAIRAQGHRASSSELQRVYHLPPGIYFHHDDPAHKLLPLAIEPSVYYAIVSDDTDFVIRKEVAQLDFRQALNRSIRQS